MEIGQKVKWTISGKTRYGIFKELKNNNLASVICLKFETVNMCLNCDVEYHLLQIDNS
jgi:hypothetical protein